mgnify:CR=1 FL=1
MFYINKISSYSAIDFAAEELKKYLRMMMPEGGDVKIAYAPDAKDGFRLGLLEDFGLPNEAEDPLLQQLADTDSRDTLLFTEDGPMPLPAGTSLEEALRKNKANTVFFGGALTDHGVKPLILSAVPLQDVTFVVRDASKILLKPDSFEKLQRRGVRLQVLRSVNLAAVTVNPFSAYGFHFDGAQLLEEMRSRIDLPVIDVMEERL